jgi:hypothetical protein
MRFHKIGGPGVAKDEVLCPNCQVMVEEREGYKTCRRCHDDTCQHSGQRRIRVRRR